MTHRPRRYSRFARIRRRLLALRHAPTTAEGLADLADLRPLASGVIVKSSAREVVASGRLTHRR